MIGIKYKALERGTNNWSYWCSDDGDNGFWEKCGVFHQKYDVMQFTGLKDKNGVEIYEGDIVKTECNIFRDEKDNIPYVSVIEYSLEYTSFKAKDIKYNSFHHKIENLKSEVIGNIYENEELLK